MSRGGRRTSTWGPGTNPTRQKGQKSSNTKLKESLGLTNWERLSSFIQREGAEMLVDKMLQLKPKDYVTAYASLAEYIKPKLQRTTLESDPAAPIAIANLSNLSFEELYQLKYGCKPTDTTAD